MKNFMFSISIVIAYLLLFIFTAPSSVQAGGDAFTQKDRELLVRLDERLNQIDKRFEQIDKRFEQIDKRFEQIDKRFEQVDKRFEELREDMNKRFEQIDKRFEELRQDMNSRFASMQNMMMAIVGAFAAIVAVTIGFAIWDRRSMVRPFEYRIKDIDDDIAEDRKKIDKIIGVFKELARNDEKMAAVLRSISLL